MPAVLGNWQWFFMAIVLPESGRTQGLILDKWRRAAAGKDVWRMCIKESGTWSSGHYNYAIEEFQAEKPFD